jgi:hypothetical protein
VQIKKVVGFIFLNPPKLVLYFSDFLRISRNFTRRWAKLQDTLDRDLHKHALHFYAKHPRSIQIIAIWPLAGRAVRARPIAGELAALPAGQEAQHVHVLT